MVPTNTTDEDKGGGKNKQQEASKSNPRRSMRIRKEPEYLEYPCQGPKYTYPAKILMLHHPRIMKIVHATIKPPTPPHIGAALKSPDRSDWLDCLFQAYDKMHKTGTLSIPFPITMLKQGTTILRPRLTCEVKITDTDNYYEEKV